MYIAQAFPANVAASMENSPMDDKLNAWAVMSIHFPHPTMILKVKD
jgi:hypothetical protein